jgi:hypothetical protein
VRILLSFYLHQLMIGEVVCFSATVDFYLTRNVGLLYHKYYLEVAENNFVGTVILQYNHLLNLEDSM